MLIQRSQSAPQPIQSSLAATKVKSDNSPAKLSRSKSYLVRSSVTSSPLATPWIEREDPFSLSGFFPASHHAAQEEEQWKWLRKEEDDSVRDDKESNSSLSVNDSDSVIGEFEDELADETIRSEDKFGLLSLDTLFSITESSMDDRLLSPYSEEAIDNDSLYLTLRARRQANQASKYTESLELGTLFFPPTDDKEEVRGGYWPSSVW